MSAFDPPRAALRAIVAIALAEDIGIMGDITSLACVPDGAVGTGAFVAREPGVLAGTAAATEVFRQVDPRVEVAWHAGDGAGPGNLDSLGVIACVASNLDEAKIRHNLADVIAKLIRENNGADLALERVVQHAYWVPEQDCPQRIRADGYWETLLDDVERLI